MSNTIHNVFASDFASLADLAAFKRAKAYGLSDQAAFAVGDNGEGCWGDTTATEATPMCALPYEDWKERFGTGAKARGALVKVSCNDKTVVCQLRDTMPHRANIKNGCGIDLNPGALKELGLKSPVKVRVTWEWFTPEPVAPSSEVKPTSVTVLPITPKSGKK